MALDHAFLRVKPYYVFGRSGNLSYGFPGVSEITLNLERDSEDWHNAVTQYTDIVVTGQRITGEMTINGHDADLIEFLTQFNASTGGGLEAEDRLTVTDAAATLSATPIDDNIEVKNLSDDGKVFEEVTAGPTKGQFAASGTELTFHEDNNDDNILCRYVADTTSGVQLNLDFTESYLSPPKSMVMAAQLIDPATSTEHTTNDCVIETSRMVFNGTIPLVGGQDASIPFHVNASYDEGFFKISFPDVTRTATS